MYPSDGLQVKEPTKSFKEAQNECTAVNRTFSRKLEVWLRVTPLKEYVKVVVLNGKVVGALLIGNTDLEETMENLILNRLDVGEFGIGLLDPDKNVEDFFD